MKRIISVILASLLVLGLFTACSSEKEPEVENTLEITFDSHYENLSESVIRAYKSLCNAIINGDETAVFSGTMTQDVEQLYYTSFPLGALVKSLTLLEDGNGYEITYVNDAETHRALVSDFTDKIGEIKEACSFGAVSNDRFVFNLYSYICKNITVDDSVLSAYETVMNGKGSAQSVSQMFEYILLQCGIKASHLTNFDSGMNILSAVYFKSGWYIFCPYREIADTSGSGLTCFAMSFERATDAFGVDGFVYSDSLEVDSAIFSNTDFDLLKDSVSYSVNDNKITVDLGNSSYELPIV